jgi:hypothetical protein
MSNLIAPQQIQLRDLITMGFDDVLGRLIFANEDQGAPVGARETKRVETALVPVSVRTAGASGALARRASPEARP